VVDSSLYLEVPFAEHWSFVATPWFEQNYDTVDGWRGEGVLGAKRVWSGEEGAFALQAGAYWQSHPDQDCGEGGVELRGLLGRNLGGGTFVNIEAAGSVLEGGCGGERLDLTLGRRWGEHWLGLAQVFGDWRAGEGYEDNVKMQLSLVRLGEGGRGLQLGLRARLDGDDAEPAVILGFWGRPGD
jgi:hypothetical protein